MNNVKKLIKENYNLSKKLNGVNDIIFTDIVCYLRTSPLDEYKVEEIIQDILDMILTAQNQGKEIKEIIGEDYKEFCDSIIEEAKEEKSIFKTCFNNAPITFEIIGILIIIDFIFNNIFPLLKGNKVNLEFTLTLGSIVNFLITGFLANFIVNYIGQNSFQITKKRSCPNKIKDFLLLMGLFIIFFGVGIIKKFLSPYVILRTKIYYLGLIILVLIFLSKYIKEKVIIK